MKTQLSLAFTDFLYPSPVWSYGWRCVLNFSWICGCKQRKQVTTPTLNSPKHIYHWCGDLLSMGVLLKQTENCFARDTTLITSTVTHILPVQILWIAPLQCSHWKFSASMWKKIRTKLKWNAAHITQWGNRAHTEPSAAKITLPCFVCKHH